jgi:hypothetical protein
VGKSALVFNLPVIDSCPGMSPTCRRVCYADRGHCRWPSNRQRNARNLTASQQPDFVERVVGELRRRDARLVRLHSSGDFYSPAYVHRWGQIAARLPGVTCWGYTRSWRVPVLLDELERLAELPNVELWFSCDRDTGLPPLVRRVRTCWLQVDDEMPPRPGPGQAPAELVFRAKRPGRNNRDKRIPLSMADRLAAPGSVLSCPNYTTGINCQDCGFCWRRPNSGVAENYNDEKHC